MSDMKIKSESKQRSRSSILSAVLTASAGVMLLILLFYLCGTVNFERQQSRTGDGFTVVNDYSSREISNENAPAGVMKEYTFTLKTLEQDTCLAFYTVHQYVELYIDGKLVYSMNPPEKTFIKTIGSNWTVFPLYREDSGKEIRINIIPAYREFLNKKVEFLIGSELSIFINRLYQDLPQFILSMITIFVGIVFLCIAVYIRLRKYSDKGLSCLGLFSLMIGLWRMTDTRSTPFLAPEKPVLMFYISVGMLMLGLVFFIKAMWPQFHKINRCILDWYCIVTSSVCIVQLLLQFTGIADLREYLYITHCMIAVGSVIFVCNVIYEEIKYSGDDKGTFRVKSMLILMAGILADIVSFYIRGTSSGLLFSLLAMLIFILTNGAGIMLHYTKQEKQIAEKERKLAENERQLAESRISTMISQIRPHFIYNTLGTIEQLCELQPETAAELVHNFSCYLRGNFSELDNPAPIHLSQEIKHIQYYISIVKIRFPDIEIRFDLRSDDFLLPALSVQPLVENAIQHGLMKLPKGGTVTISSYETDTLYCICVEDNGAGFDTSVLPDEKAHIGLRNIRSRLESMSSGTLTVESTPGVGTKVLITISKKVKK